MQYHNAISLITLATFVGLHVHSQKNNNKTPIVCKQKFVVLTFLTFCRIMMRVTENEELLGLRYRQAVPITEQTPSLLLPLECYQD